MAQQRVAPQRIGGRVVGTGATADNSAVTVNREQQDWNDYTKATGKKRTFDSSEMMSWKKKRDAGQAVLKAAPKENLMTKLKVDPMAKGLTSINKKR